MAVMPSDDLATRIRTASRSCPEAVSGQVFRSPAQAFADLARSCAELGIEEWDVYGESGPVGRLEAELVELFGVEAVPGRLGAVLAELPLREAGCLLPTWDDLAELSQACRARGVVLHFDGARIWESQPWFGRGLPEIAALADSLYVSFYKGLGGMAGAALLGPADFIAEARLWRRRQGGTIYHLTAEAVSALAGLHDQLPVVADTVAWARAFAAELPSFIAVQPGVPHANQFLAYAAGDADAVNERLLALIEERRIGFPAWRAAQEPGRITTEFAVSRAALKLDPAKMAALVATAIAPTAG